MKYWYMLPCAVNESTIGTAIIEIFKQFHANPNVQVTLYISSTGGDIDSAIRFYDFIKSSKIRLNTVGFGQVDSAALVLFLSGTKRTLVKDCRVRLHEPTYSGPQQAQVISVHKETTSLLQELDKRYFEIIASELQKPEGDTRNILVEGKVLSATEALEMKIATEIKDEFPVDR
ncbi:MAG: ATP-dependent Clp protease proteolytic subunit [Candidatus Paceibacterota bacterium]